MSDRLDLLHEVIETTADFLHRVPPETASWHTPCTDYRVSDLVDHLVGWIHIFEAAAHDSDAARDPELYLVESEHAAAFRRAGTAAVAGLRERGLDRGLTMVSSPLPGEVMVDMMTMEYPGHAWDLAVATGLAYPFDDRVVRAAHRAAERTIQPPYRGYEEGQFRPVVPTPPDATPLERYVAFLGRDPAWSGETNS